MFDFGQTMVTSVRLNRPEMDSCNVDVTRRHRDSTMSSTQCDYVSVLFSSSTRSALHKAPPVLLSLFIRSSTRLISHSTGGGGGVIARGAAPAHRSARGSEPRPELERGKGGSKQGVGHSRTAGRGDN